MSESLKDQAIKGVGWSAVERFSVQGVTFLIQIVLARLLTPADYGIIGMLTIFLQIAQVFIDSGFGSALIQKQDCKDEDYSTVFFYNLAVSIAFYLLLFFCAPLVSRFYDVELLTPVLRVVALTLIINSLSIVQKTKLVKSVDFKSQSKVSLSSSVLSGAIGIYLAYKGFGVWALVVQQVSNSVLQFVFYLLVARWFPKLSFSKESFKFVFEFGSKLLAASIISTIYRNIYTIVIGKKFSETELGLYSRAESFAIFPSSNIGSIISRVAFPILSKIQNDDEKLCVAYRKIIRYSSYVIFPLMIGLIALSDPFIITFLTEKWSAAIIILQILCLDWMLDHLSSLNLNLLYVKGRTDLVLRLEIIKKSIAIGILFLSLPLGLTGMCWGRVLYSVIATVINTFYTKRLIGLSFSKQIADIIPYLFSAAIMGVTVYYSTMIVSAHWLKLLLGIIIGVFVYTAITMIFFKPIAQYGWTFLSKTILKKRNA